jgi:two-component system chemotaxis sensor kinase CheA
MKDEMSFLDDETVNLFFEESREMLQDIETSLLEIERGNHDDETLNSIFRAAHTIKGSSGMFGFEHIEKFTHVLENLLDNVRKKTLSIDPSMSSLLLECKDHIENLMDFYRDRVVEEPDDELKERDISLLERLNRFLQAEEKEGDDPEKTRPAACENPPPEEPGRKVESGNWHISLRFGKDLFRSGMEPHTFISYLNKSGSVECVSTVTDSIPPLDSFDPEECYLGFEIDFKGDVTKEELEDVFEFVKDDCVIRIIPPRSKIEEYIRLIEELPEKNFRIGEILKEAGTLTDAELNEVLDIQQEATTGTQRKKGEPLGKIIADEKMADKKVVDAAIEKQNSIRRKLSTIRIDADKLDKLINFVGELVISGASIKQVAESKEINRLALMESVSNMTRLIEDIRESAMSIRMVQIGETFRKFERVVRDLSKERNKEIDLVINGGETELDKTLIEKISDPLMHLIRNAIDHGIDHPEDRINKGKPRRGKITLNACHEAGNIVIEVIDDGDGLNREKILSKAVAAGLVKPDQAISDQELFQFIFHAGFSTAHEVTNISGRGVGMDVVKRNIESLRGTIILESNEGKGTGIKIHLPLTLSIIDGFLVEVNGSYYVVPLDLVLECIEVSKSDLNARDGGNYLNLRGDALPYLKMRDFFKIEGDEPEISYVIVLNHLGGIAGLVVDNLIGEFQTVIKPLGEIFSELKWISGSTVLGSGEVAVILDVLNLIKNIKGVEEKQFQFEERAH